MDVIACQLGPRTTTLLATRETRREVAISLHGDSATRITCHFIVAMRQQLVKPATSIWTAKGRVNRYPPSRMTALGAPAPPCLQHPEQADGFLGGYRGGHEIVDDQRLRALGLVRFLVVAAVPRAARQVQVGEYVGELAASAGVTPLTAFSLRSAY